MSSLPEPELPICYLCGLEIIGKPSSDHVPPRQFYSSEIRKLHSPNLRTLDSHGECNRSFQLDEEYFIHSIAPLVRKTYSGKSLLNELLSQYKGKRNVRLSRKILAEFEERPSGLILPTGKIVKRIDPDRIWRVVWKIVRGLFFIEYDRILPNDTPKSFKLISPDERPPDEFFLITDEPIRGQYPGVFDYKYRVIEKLHNAHFWALLFWDQVIMLTLFHDPDCSCEICIGT